jgi:hypothetical protein
MNSAKSIGVSPRKIKLTVKTFTRSLSTKKQFLSLVTPNSKELRKQKTIKDIKYHALGG